MRRLLASLILMIAGGAADAAQFEGWNVACGTGKPAGDCRVEIAASRTTATSATLAAQRAGPKDAQPKLTLSIDVDGALNRPRVALAVDGGPPIRFASGADLASAPGPGGGVEIRFSDAATRKLLPFLRRGKMLTVAIVAEDRRDLSADFALPGFASALAEVDRAQGRVDRPDALIALVGGDTPAVRSGQVRDVSRENAPPALRQIMVDRDCPVWDRNETDASFLAEESFAADLGGGLTLWAMVCASGATNVDFTLFLEDPSRAAGRFEPLLFAAFLESVGWTGVDVLSNVAYDPSKKQLTAFDRGRAQGDCGQVGTWEWGGAAFRMVEYRAKEECDGVGEPGKFPIVFRGER
ncbi:DUF1176 domain-containing protein [Methylopila sp. 73B]|uniref:DUF1176 domain-containing protein n=1 Tax=Methylopila sp. 73B TaxID=1120792 RepID=UPI00037E1FB2|nr:DUF1176 domain-containing protein [Methylopila sp. 73B]